MTLSVAPFSSITVSRTKPGPSGSKNSVRRVLGYNGNGVNYRRVTAEVANGGYREFAFR